MTDHTAPPTADVPERVRSIIYDHCFGRGPHSTAVSREWADDIAGACMDDLIREGLLAESLQPTDPGSDALVEFEDTIELKVPCPDESHGGGPYLLDPYCPACVAVALAALDEASKPQDSGGVDDLTLRLVAADQAWGATYGDGPSNPNYLVFLARQVTQLRPSIPRLYRPEIVCLSGSMRFADLMHRAAATLTAQNVIVLMPHVTTTGAPDDAFKRRLDDLHRVKITLADRLIVVSDDTGYYGDSTSSEIGWAKELGRPVTAWRMTDVGIHETTISPGRPAPQQDPQTLSAHASDLVLAAAAAIVDHIRPAIAAVDAAEATVPTVLEVLAAIDTVPDVLRELADEITEHRQVRP